MEESLKSYLFRTEQRCQCAGGPREVFMNSEMFFSTVCFHRRGLDTLYRGSVAVPPGLPFLFDVLVRPIVFVGSRSRVVCPSGFGSSLRLCWGTRSSSSAPKSVPNLVACPYDDHVVIRRSASYLMVED
jgi:hypothetical protein